jgi:hypothetical protein
LGQSTTRKNYTDEIEGEFDIYLELFVLLYADDTVLFSDSASDLQLQLNIFCEYCNIWKLKVNSSKSKIIIFSSLTSCVTSPSLIPRT